MCNRYMSEHQLRVEEFMVKAKQTIPPKPTVPAPHVLQLRAKLIWEEFAELLEAMGLKPALDNNAEHPKGSMTFTPVGEVDMVEAADAMADLSVVLNGTATAFGIALEEILQEVDKNNLAKFGPGHSVREDGKLIKPPGHKPPDIHSLLLAQGWEPHDKQASEIHSVVCGNTGR